MWCDENLEDKRKLRYYKEAINHNLEDQNYLSILTSVKDKVHIAKIKTNSHELHSKIGHWTFPKTSWAERVCHLYETMNVEYENNFLLHCSVYKHIRSQFQNFSYNMNLSNLLSHQNYSNLGTLLSKLVEHRNIRV